MKQYLFVGDLHGDLKAALYAIKLAHSLRAEIIQVGDWGFLWSGGIDKTLELSTMLVDANVHMRFIDGNHDIIPVLKQFAPGDFNVAEGLTYQPRGSLHIDEDGTRFVFLGGAPSIDKDDRAPGRDWWPEEEITVEEAWLAQSHERADVLVTHDAPGLPPYSKPLPSMWEFTEKADRSRSIIASVCEGLRPKLLVHGHYHRPYRGTFYWKMIHGWKRDGDLLPTRETAIVGLGQNGLGRFDEMCFQWRAFTEEGIEAPP